MFETETNTPLGALLDLVIRKANIVELSDYLIGVQLDYDQDVASLYFSDRVEEERLKALQENLAEQEQLKASFEKTTEGGAAWVLKIRQIPEEVEPTTGDIGVKVALQGDLLRKGVASPVTTRATSNQVPVTSNPRSMPNANHVRQVQQEI